MVIEGGFKISDDGGNKVLELEAEPVADGAMLFGQSIKGAGTITARIKAGKGRRAFPRFGVGLHGISGTKLRIVPAQKQIEIAREDEVKIRSTATANRIPIITTLRAAKASLDGIRALKQHGLNVKPLQAWHAK